MNIIYNPQKNDWKELLRGKSGQTDKTNENGVKLILKNIMESGDKALLSYVKIFDNINIKASELVVSEKEFEEATSKISNELSYAINCAISNVKKFHTAQKSQDISVETMPGVTCRQKSIPIGKVGLYIPGGTAPLFSTVIMLAVPAKLAGCKEIILCTPVNKEGKIAPEVLYCAKLCGVDKVYRVGGPAAIAAMAYGTESIPKVDKIFGPGNSYVTIAKQLISNDICAIDMPAGPSEVMILADDSANAQFICADFLAQLEHGNDSQAVLATTSPSLAKQVQKLLKEQIEELSRKGYIYESLKKSRIVVLSSAEELAEIANEYAPEHLIICTENYKELAEEIENAGSIFLGNYSTESAGDYASGTNHTLPTGGWAQSYSGVNLQSFTKKITIQEITKEGLRNIGKIIQTMAYAEGLDAHAKSVSIRMKE
ncbi:MAG: histidinol dehydrogenase [Bacteroidales bacterium]|nr:histidinol dehydrogenase [Bacteroidales bacterium]